MAKITKEQMEEIRKDMDAALLAVAEKHGLTSLKTGKGKYDPKFGSFSFGVDGVTADGLDKYASTYDLWAALMEWPALFSEFEYQNKTFKITGCNSTRSKIYCKTGDKTFQFHEKDIKTIFQRKALLDVAKREGK